MRTFRLLAVIYFYPCPPRGGRPLAGGMVAVRLIFLSTPSARRATPGLSVAGNAKNISIHALREEGDTRAAATGSTEPISIHALREEGDCRTRSGRTAVQNFYPRPPRGGRRAARKKSKCGGRFLSTPSARRATGCTGIVITVLSISIHALREEGDGSSPAGSACMDYFYPRPPRGGRLTVSGYEIEMKVFLSTPSARRATHGIVAACITDDISIHAQNDR